MTNQSSDSPLSELIRHIRGLIAEGDLSEAVDETRNIALNASRDLADEAIALAGRHAHLVRNDRKGILTNDESRVERRRIEAAVLGLLEELERNLPRTAAPVPAQVAAVEAFADTEVVGFEKIIGVNNLRQIAWIEQAVHASRAACRIVTSEGLGSGFLIGPHTLMTNNHVIASVAVARETKVEFNYQLPFGAGGEPSGAVRYDLDPEMLFRTSPATDLDYTVVAVKTDGDSDKPALDTWGSLHLNPNADPVVNEHVVIVQHPNGGPKQIVLTANAVLQVMPPYLHYSTDTMAGSSGSPVFNDLWQVVAIHHAAGPSVKVPSGGTRHSNEGVLMSSIKCDLGDDWPK